MMAGENRFATEVGARLRQARKARGMSLLDVEKQSGGRWDDSALRSWEAATRAMLVEHFDGLARFYGLDPRWLAAEAARAAMMPRAVAA